MSSFEYRVWDYDFAQENHEVVADDFVQRKLNEIGAEGWELVSAVAYTQDEGAITDGILYHFKRKMG